MSVTTRTWTEVRVEDDRGFILSVAIDSERGPVSLSGQLLAVGSGGAPSPLFDPLELLSTVYEIGRKAGLLDADKGE